MSGFLEILSQIHSYSFQFFRTLWNCLKSSHIVSYTFGLSQILRIFRIVWYFFEFFQILPNFFELFSVYLEFTQIFFGFYRILVDLLRIFRILSFSFKFNGILSDFLLFSRIFRIPSNFFLFPHTFFTFSRILWDSSGFSSILQNSFILSRSFLISPNSPVCSQKSGEFSHIIFGFSQILSISSRFLHILSEFFGFSHIFLNSFTSFRILSDSHDFSRNQFHSHRLCSYFFGISQILSNSRPPVSFGFSSALLSYWNSINTIPTWKTTIYWQPWCFV